jgi:protein-S-isoprenylcysteine O-methyltransferase Ste14
MKTGQASRLPEVTTMTMQGSAPKQITWIICLVLYLVALLTHFGVIHPGNNIGEYSWIAGYALLLIAVQVRGL